MSRRPVLEEVNDDDIDNLDMDIAEFDPDLKTPVAPRRPAPSIVRSQDENPEPPLFPQMGDIPVPTKQQTHERSNIIDPKSFTPEQEAHFKKFQIIYPCYFDINRSHKQGRRVSIDRAVENPIAKTISDACQFLKVPVLLELDKTHPQDFGNPGRVRVLLREPEGGKPINSLFLNKKRFMNEIADYLATHPTELDSVGRKSGIAMPQDFQQNFTPEEIPKVKGFKMNTIVPVHSSFTMKHPMTKSIYDAEPENEAIAPSGHKTNIPKPPKKKVMKIRG
ncbi:SEC65 [Candida oxycetoniae]|uniref:Signal recognition particle SEC65 subunit n=1 Tax=Candida oxycetoniae TaxID=497107 RepID=A0AAI9SXI3_9ASCO|nr:SEC65 [Candida oxycetoniae]KAI3404822.1 SEC65 [Candida oxycetoniae]